MILSNIYRVLSPLGQAAGLEVVADVMESQCLLIVGKQTKHRAMVDLIVRRIEGYITAEKCEALFLWGLFPGMRFICCCYSSEACYDR